MFFKTQKLCLILLNVFVLLLNFARPTITTTNVTTIKISKNLEDLEDLEPKIFLHTVDDNPIFQQKIDKIKSFPCIPRFRRFTLELNTPLKPGESIGLTGDHKKLGQWQLDKSLKMRRIDSAGLKWFTKIYICASTRMHYRYFIYYTDTHGNKRIRRWEGMQHPRVLELYESRAKRESSADVFGNLYPFYIGGGIQQEPGWLRHEYVIELKFIYPQQLRLFGDIEQERIKSVWLKLEILNEHEARKIADIEITTSKYSYNSSQFTTQPIGGVEYADGDIIVFQITLPLNSRHNYKLRLFHKNKQEIGFALILSTDLEPSEGTLKLPIFSPDFSYLLGDLTLPYLIINPHPDTLKFNLRTSFQHFWPLNWPVLDIGYRGVGPSYFSSQDIAVENTIDSFLLVPQLNGDMVTLDIQLTKDGIPIVWHDFGFYTAPKHKNVQNNLDLNYVLIKNLSFKQLKRKRVFVYKKTYIMEFTHLNTNDTTNDARIFPTLAEVYQRLPITLGLIVNIKWPQLLFNDEMESMQTIDKNHYVNVIIETTNNYACGRPLIFTSFDADICTMIRQKQSLYPVILTILSEKIKTGFFKDLRTRNYKNAINFAQSEDILGTSPNIADFENDISNNDKINNNNKNNNNNNNKIEELINLSLNLQQAIFIWGYDVFNKETIEILKDHEVTGLIYGRIDLQGPVDKFQTFFTASELREIFARQCTAAGNINHVEYLKLSNDSQWRQIYKEFWKQ